MIIGSGSIPLSAILPQNIETITGFFLFLMAFFIDLIWGKLKTAVTGKVKKGSKAAKRRKSYCARSLGQLKRSSAKTKNDPNSRIRQARRRWKC